MKSAVSLAHATRMHTHTCISSCEFTFRKARCQINNCAFPFLCSFWALVANPLLMSMLSVSAYQVAIQFCGRLQCSKQPQPQPQIYKHTRTHTHVHTRTHARTHTHTHTQHHRHTLNCHTRKIPYIAWACWDILQHTAKHFHTLQRTRYRI